MRLKSEKRFTNESYADLNTRIYRVNDEIYDEINFRDGKYFVLHRCGIEQFKLDHGREVYFTDQKTLVYPLAEEDYWEEEIEGSPLKTFGENTVLSVINGQYEVKDVEVEVDHRYVEEQRHFYGNDITLDTKTEDDFDDDTAYVMSITNTQPVNNNASTWPGSFYFPRCFTFNGLTEKINNSLHSLGIKQTDGTYLTALTEDFEYDYSHENYWKCYQYESCGFTKDDIVDKEPIDSYMYYFGDFNTNNLGRALKKDYTLYMYTYVYNSEKVDYPNNIQALYGGIKGYTVYTNGVEFQKPQNWFNSTNYGTLVPGWNLVEIIFQSESSRGIGFMPNSGQWYEYFQEIKKAPHTGTSIFNRMNYQVKPVIGSTGLQIHTKNPFRSIGNVNDKFVRIIPKNPDLVNSTSLVHGWKFCHQRNIGDYILSDTETTTIQDIQIDDNSYQIYTFTIDTAKPESELCESDRLLVVDDFSGDEQIKILGTSVSICLVSGKNLSQYKGTTILYELAQSVYEPILNQEETYSYMDKLYRDDYDWDKKTIYLVDAPDQPVSFDAVFGEHILVFAPIFNTIPGHQYILRRGYSSSDQYYNGNSPVIVWTYDNHMNRNGWYDWDEFVRAFGVSGTLACSGFYTCPDNVYGVRVLSQYGSSSYNNYHIGNGNNLFDMQEFTDNLTQDAYPNATYSVDGNSFIITAPANANSTIKQSNVKYSIPAKQGKTYVFYWECDDYSINFNGAIGYYKDNTWYNQVVYGNAEQYGNHFAVLNLPKTTAVNNIRPYFGSIPAGKTVTISNMQIYEFDNANSLKTFEYEIDGQKFSQELPFVLNPDNEYVYSPDRNTWTRLGLESTAAIYTENTVSDEIFKPIKFKKGQRIRSLNPSIILGVTANYKSKRELQSPTGISLSDGYKTGDYGYGFVEWNSIIGATEYRILVNNEIIATIDAEYDHRFAYQFTGETRGKFYIEAANDLGVIARTSEYDVETVPASIEFDSFDSNYENNRYYIDVKFKKSSKTADQYLLMYSLDGGNNNIIKYPNDGSGDEINEKIIITSVSDNISFQLLTSNASGDNDYDPMIELKPCEGFDIWTYKEGSKQILTSFYDKFDDEDYYNIKYRIDDGSWQIMQVDGSDKPNERLIEYLDLQPNQTMDMCLAPVRQGYANLYSPPITVSKDLDTTLLAPKNFTGTKLSDGKIQFTWLDDYWIDSAFELYYTYSDGSSETVKIDQDMDYGSYVYSTENYGFINARVKMVWEFGESAYTDFIIVYNIPEVEKAPTIEGKYRDENDVNKLKITWQQYDFIKNYIVYFTVDGIQKQLDSPDSEYLWDIPNDNAPHTVSCRVQAKFIDDSLTDISDSISFTVVQTSEKQQTVIYATPTVEYPEYTTIYTQGLQQYFNVYTYSLNTYDTEYPIYMKRYEPGLEQFYSYYSDFWGHNIGPEYLIRSDILNKFTEKYPIEQIQYSKTKTDDLIQTMVYRNTTSDYRIESEFVKMVICCLGDSITAGHPNYWANYSTQLSRNWQRNTNLIAGNS